MGAVLGLASVAVSYGILRATLTSLKTDFIKHEQDTRDTFRDHEDRVRYLERWYDRTKGADKERAKNRDASIDETKTFERRKR